MSTPSIVPQDDDRSVHLVIDDLGHHGCVWREANSEMTDLQTVITDLIEGQYRNPVRIIAFNVAEGWSRDVSEDVAHELRRRADLQLTDLPDCLVDFVIRHESKSRNPITSKADRSIRSALAVPPGWAHRKRRFSARLAASGVKRESPPGKDGLSSAPFCFGD